MPGWFGIAPRGSVYHHFPGGKRQLGEEVIRRSGQMYFEIFEMIFDAAPDPVAGVRDFFDGAAEVLRATDYADACPIATVALEISSTVRKQMGVTLAGGQGELRGKIVRIGHIGYVDIFDVVTGLAAMELALAEAGADIERGAGPTRALGMSNRS